MRAWGELDEMEQTMDLLKVFVEVNDEVERERDI